jgi:5-methylcytosine-specific restriction endonuclease McrA
MLNSKVLVLNRSYLPIHVTSVRRAFSLIYQGGARAVNAGYETFDFNGWLESGFTPEGDVIGTSRGGVPVPRVILLTHFDRLPKRQLRFSRSNIFTRDRFTCQYCAERPPRAQLNLDHVVPRAQGGRTTWENIVCCCVPCNRRKGGRTPEQAGVRLHRRPMRPRWSPLMVIVPLGVRYREWKPFLSGVDASLHSS